MPKIWASTDKVWFQYGFSTGLSWSLFFPHKNPSSTQFSSATGRIIVVPIILMFTSCFKLQDLSQNPMFSQETVGFAETSAKPEVCLQTLYSKFTSS